MTLGANTCAKVKFGKCKALRNILGRAEQTGAMATALSAMLRALYSLGSSDILRPLPCLISGPQRGCRFTARRFFDHGNLQTLPSKARQVLFQRWY